MNVLLIYMFPVVLRKVMGEDISGSDVYVLKVRRLFEETKSARFYAL